jgi:hypothetical protein
VSETVVGQPTQNTPRWTAAATAQYTLPLADGRSAFAMGQYTYTGSRVSYNNFSAGYYLPSYSIVNLRLGLNQGPWQAALFVRNLLDKLGVIGDMAPDGAVLPGRDRLFVTRPRTIGVELRRNLN